MIYELRVYDAAPGQLQTVVKVIEAAMPFFKKHDMNVVGCWTPAVGGGSNQFRYMLAFRDMGHLEAAWKAFRSDPEWPKARLAAVGELKTPHSTKATNYVLTATSYSPLQ